MWFMSAYLVFFLCEFKASNLDPLDSPTSVLLTELPDLSIFCITINIES